MSRLRRIEQLQAEIIGLKNTIIELINRVSINETLCKCDFPNSDYPLGTNCDCEVYCKKCGNSIYNIKECETHRKLLFLNGDK